MAQNYGTVQPGQTVTYTETITITDPLFGENPDAGLMECTFDAEGICNGQELLESKLVQLEVEPPTNIHTAEAICDRHGSMTHMYTLANMKNWTNNHLAIAFTNLDHTVIESFNVHTTSRTDSYYNGNGGTFKFHIYSDNGGLPGVSLASTPDYIGATSLTSTGGPWVSQAQAQATYPNAIWSSYGETGNDLRFHRRFNLSAPLSVTPGTRYHLVMIRTTSTAHGTSLNGYLTGSMPKNDDPNFNVGDWRITQSQNGTSWQTIPHVGIFDIQGDGTTIGNAAHEIAAFTDADRSNNIDGSSAARECWRPHKTMTICDLRVQAIRRFGSAPLDYEIKNSGGTVLASGELSGYPVYSTGPDILVRDILRQMTRESDSFTPITLVSGQLYYIELKTTPGTHYEIGMTRDGVLSANGYYDVDPAYHGWGPTSRAETSTNNGVSWSLPINWNSPNDYLALEADVGEIC